MNVLAVNCSPKGDKGGTALILKPFLDGMRSAGATVTVQHTNKLRIGPCLGDHICWFRTPGRCHLQDDMQAIYPLARDADVWVFGTPVYCDGVTGPMKNLLDRTIALLEPYFELRDDHCRHPRRPGVKTGKLALVSTCGFWEMDNFRPLVAHLEAWCRNADREFAGALLRPHAPALAPYWGLQWDDVLKAAEEAGRQLVVDGRMAEDTLRTVSRPLLSREPFVERINEVFHRLVARAEKTQ